MSIELIMKYHPGEIIQLLVKNHVILAQDMTDNGIVIQHDKRERFLLGTVSISDRPAYLIKQARTAAAKESLGKEINTYLHLSGNKHLARLTPGMVAHDHQQGFMVIQWLSNAETINITYSSGQAAALLAPLLCKLHQHTLSRTGIPHIPPATPWILGCLEKQSAWQPAELDFVLPLINDISRLRELLHKARYYWSPQSLIHGDLKWEHCLACDQGTHQGIFLIDWELAGHGDPAWDVASIVSDILFSEHYTYQYAPSETEDMLLSETVLSFLENYNSEMIYSREFINRVVLLTAARLLQTSLELTSVYGISEQKEILTVLSMIDELSGRHSSISKKIHSRLIS